MKMRRARGEKGKEHKEGGRLRRGGRVKMMRNAEMLRNTRREGRVGKIRSVGRWKSGEELVQLVVASNTRGKPHLGTKFGQQGVGEDVQVGGARLEWVTGLFCHSRLQRSPHTLPVLHHNAEGLLSKLGRCKIVHGDFLVFCTVDTGGSGGPEHTPVALFFALPCNSAS